MLRQQVSTQQKIESQSLFYNGAFYDRIFHASPRFAQQSQDVSFWLEIAERYGSPILELACGTGRISAPLSQKGFAVTGIDLSDSMLMAARQKSQQVQWLQADVRNFDLQTQFSLIAFPYDTFTHLHDLADIKACLRCVSQHLAPGGHFIIDFKNPYYVLKYIGAPNHMDTYAVFQDPYRNQQVTAIRESRYDAVQQFYYSTLHFSWEGSEDTHSEVLKLRIFFPQEIESLLVENGFTVVQKFGNYQQDPFSLDSSHHILVCQLTSNS